MYADPKREGELQTRADPFSLDSFISWLEQQPTDKEYCFIKNGECLHAQYFQASGYRRAKAGTDLVYLGDNRTRRLSVEFRMIARNEPHTFGAALERARALRG